MVEKKVIYIVSAFPCFSEAFILREMVALKKKGVGVSIFSLRKLNEPVLQPDVLSFLPDTRYLPFCLSWKVWKDNLYWLIRKPAVYVWCLVSILSECCMQPEILFKTLAIFPKSVSFARTAVDLKASHVHSHFASYPTTAALIVHRLAGVPFTFSAHAHDIFYSKALLGPKCRESKMILTVSEYNRRYLTGLFPWLDQRKIEIVRSPVDCEKFRYRDPKPANGRVILSVGRLATMKGFRFLIEACGILKKERVQFNCRIIGDGPLKDTLVRLIEQHGLGAEVSLYGAIPEDRLLEEYANASVFVLPCVPTKEHDTQDGLPAVLVEAMAVGIPVVSTKLSGIPELVIDNQTGILIPIQDSRAIAHAVKAVLDDPGLRQRLARNGRKKVETEFNIALNVEKLIGVFFQ